MGFLVVAIIYGIICFCQIQERNARVNYYNEQAKKYYAIGNRQAGDLYTREAVNAKRS